MADLWNDENSVRDDYGITVPEWIEQDITPSTVAAIIQGGCASGAYMPACTYYDAAQTMADHGDDVLDYIEGNSEIHPSDFEGVSWSGLACLFLSRAVEVWALSIEPILSDAIDERETGV